MNRKREATEIDALRQSARKTRLDRCRNETIKEQIHLKETAIEIIEE